MQGRACRICGGLEHDELYRGPIRIGRFGELSPEPHAVWRCLGCGAGWLPGVAVDYESSEYRLLVDGTAHVDDFHRLHDGEQAERLRMLGTGELRGRVVMDVGCGAGSFLDLVKGMCETTIGIEPTASLRECVAAKGHQAFAYSDKVPAQWEDRVDAAVAFSLVEHVDDPVALLRDVRRLLRPGGRLLVSTPNRSDWLLELLPDDYRAFFYRRVHRWYFDGAALTALLRHAGFEGVSVRCLHRFDVSNAVLWLRDRRPTGLGTLSLPAAWNDVFRTMLEATGRGDYLYASAVKP